MRVYNLSSNPNEPCFVLQFNKLSLMLDCGLDMSPFMHYLPLPVVEKTHQYPAHNPDMFNNELRDLGAGTTLVDSEPEVLPPESKLFPFSDIDAILISNYTCMLALPFVTEAVGFKGKVYATEPTLLLGKIFMEELLEYINRTPRHQESAKWKKVLSQLPPPLCDIDNVDNWRRLYTRDSMESSLAKVQMVGFNETTSVFGLLDVSPVSSGYCLGSCNWLLTTGHEKIVYVSSSSILSTHPKNMDQLSIRNADCMILTALTQTPLQMPDPMIGEFCRLVCDTLKASGNVLVPCYPSGIIYDLFECLSNQMDMNGLTTVPMFFFSPVSDSSLAYSNILAEWLSPAKHNRVYVPEEPFVHGALLRGGRLKSFSSLGNEAVTREYRQPCVVFTGHPSLRCGDVVHFLELWGANNNNLIVFTEPSVNYQQALSPYQPLAMKVVHCPIDTGLNFAQTRKLLSESRPRNLVIPHRYSQPPASAPNRQDLVIDRVPDTKLFTIQKNDILKIPLTRRYDNLSISSTLAASLVPVEVRPGVAVATVSGNLVVKDNTYTLNILEDEEDGEIVRVKREEGSGKDRKRLKTDNKRGSIPLTRQTPPYYLYGSINSTEFVNKLAGKGIGDAKVETGKDGGFPVQIHLPQEETLIQVLEDQTHVLYDQVDGTDPAVTEKLRQVMKESVLSCVTKF